MLRHAAFKVAKSPTPPAETTRIGTAPAPAPRRVFYAPARQKARGPAAKPRPKVVGRARGSQIALVLVGANAAKKSHRFEPIAECAARERPPFAPAVAEALFLVRFFAAPLETPP